MRGSVYYQATQLVKVIFRENAKKIERIDPLHYHNQCVASYETMATYRRVWENMFNYLKEYFKLKNMELITKDHIISYMFYKIEYYPSKNYLQKISSAIGKLELALNRYSMEKYDTDPINYDFSIREYIFNEANNLNLIASNYKNRAFRNPGKIIEYMNDEKHQVAARIQLIGGARVEGILLIKKEQLKGHTYDTIEEKNRGVIFTKEKGGKEGDVLINVDDYKYLEEYFETTKKTIFKLDYQKYLNDIKQACEQLKLVHNGTHGFRWNFAQRRVSLYQKKGYSYNESLKKVSHEMKHNRASITLHYM